MKIILFEEGKDLHPLTLTRPCFDIRISGITLYEMVTKIFRKKPFFSVPEHLEETTKARYKKSIRDADIRGTSLYINSHVPPSEKLLKEIRKLKEQEMLFDSEGKVIAFRTGDSERYEKKQLDVPIPKKPWHLEKLNEELLEDNLRYLSKFFRKKGSCYVGRKVRIAKTAVIRGLVILDDEVEIADLAVIQGPAYIGRDTRINENAHIKVSSIGRSCKIGGEVSSTVIQDYTNKQHLGFLGNSYVGSWVNIGAGTTTSNLKNTYGTIRIRGEDTGEQFIGSIIADHAKISINVTLLTGKVIGVNSHVFGTVSEDVPSFTSYARSLGDISELRLASAIRTQARVYGRRGIEQTPPDENLLRKVFAMTKKERSKVPKKRISI